MTVFERLTLRLLIQILMEITRQKFSMFDATLNAISDANLCMRKSVDDQP